MRLLSKEEIKTIQLELLKYIDEICVKNKIDYTLIGGSLIGAIRHKGMIPWDDDIDIGLTKENYDKLIKILISNSSNTKFKLLNHDTNDKYYYAFSKLISSDTKLIEKNFEEIEGYGVYVDIFCYYNLPDDFKHQSKYYKKIRYYNKMLGGIKKINYDKNIIKNFVKFLRYCIVKLVGKQHYFIKLKKLHNKYNKSDCNYLMSDWPIYNIYQEIKEKNLFNSYIRVEFDGIEVSIISEYDIFLRETFDDYMKLPPENERKTHGLTAYLKNK